MPLAVAALAAILVSTARAEWPAAATHYSESDMRIWCLVQEQATASRHCAKQQKRTPDYVWTEMAKGLIDGQRRWWPGRPDKTLDVLAYALTETGGNVVFHRTRWGWEIGCMGLNHNLAKEACDFWQIKMPKTTDALMLRLKRDHRWCAYVTYGALVMNAGQYGGNLLWGVMRTKLGKEGVLREVRKHGDDVAKFPATQGFLGMRSWLACIEDWQDCGRCLQAFSRADFPGPAGVASGPPVTEWWGGL